MKFIIYTPAGAAQNARFKALEIVSANVDWLLSKEEEIENAFNPRGLKLAPPSAYKKPVSTNSEEFRNKVKEFLNNSKEFQQIKSQFTKKI